MVKAAANVIEFNLEEAVNFVLDRRINGSAKPIFRAVFGKSTQFLGKYFENWNRRVLVSVHPLREQKHVLARRRLYGEGFPHLFVGEQDEVPPGVEPTIKLPVAKKNLYISAVNPGHVSWSGDLFLRLPSGSSVAINGFKMRTTVASTDVAYRLYSVFLFVLRDGITQYEFVTELDSIIAGFISFIGQKSREWSPFDDRARPTARVN
jgi:hypothetical protein